MRKYYDEPTIRKTLHCNKNSLVAMISATTSMRKNPESEKNFNLEKKFFSGQELSKKKLAPRGATS